MQPRDIVLRREPAIGLPQGGLGQARDILDPEVELGYGEQRNQSPPARRLPTALHVLDGLVRECSAHGEPALGKPGELAALAQQGPECARGAGINRHRRRRLLELILREHRQGRL